MISDYPENEALRKVEPDRSAFVCQFFALEDFLEARLVDLATSLLFSIKSQGQVSTVHEEGTCQ